MYIDSSWISKELSLPLSAQWYFIGAPPGRWSSIHLRTNQSLFLIIWEGGIVGCSAAGLFIWLNASIPVTLSWLGPWLCYIVDFTYKRLYFIRAVPIHFCYLWNFSIFFPLHSCHLWHVNPLFTKVLPLFSTLNKIWHQYCGQLTITWIWRACSSML
jgi:hypothetical protein